MTYTEYLLTIYVILNAALICNIFYRDIKKVKITNDMYEISDLKKIIQDKDIKIADHRQEILKLGNKMVSLEKYCEQLSQPTLKLQDILEQHHKSTTPMDDYHTGFYNGLECCICLLDKREPKFKSVEI